jgi:hypothetical protein
MWRKLLLLAAILAPIVVLAAPVLVDGEICGIPLYT